MKRDEEGVHPIANTDNPQRVADIVFVHGLKGGAHSTWTHGKEGEEGFFFWPEQLGQELQQCGIWTLGYAAGISRIEKRGMIFSKRGENLATQMSNNGLGQRPLVFITHSMGGLVVKSMITRSVLTPNKRFKSLVSKVRGIVFCGTPHLGSDYAKYANTLTRYFSRGFEWLITMFGWNFGGLIANWLEDVLKPQQHVADMANSSVALTELNSDFIQWCRVNPVEIESYAESQGLLTKTWLGRALNLGIVVPDSSSKIGFGVAYDVDCDHVDLVKLTPSRKPVYDTVYLGTAFFIKRILEAINSDVLDNQDIVAVQPSSIAPEKKTSNWQIDSSAIDLNSEKEEGLRDIQQNIVDGRYALAERDVRKWMSKTSIWNLLSKSTKAKAYRILIHAVLSRTNKTDDAKALLANALIECPGERFVTTEAFFAITDGDVKIMLETYPTPVTEEEWRWKLLLLINNEQYEETIQAATDPAAPFPISDSIQACLTWAYLGLKRLEEARKSNEIALKSQPNGLGNLEAQALIAYASAISPYSVHWLESAYPLPIEAECLYTTPEARQHFIEAAKIFEELSLRMDSGSVKQIRYLTWCFAVWCNLARISLEGRDQAMENALAVFGRIQEQQPAFHIAIHWALLARLPLDLKSIEKIFLNKPVESKHEDVEMLCQIYLHQGKEIEAAVLLDQYKEQYHGDQAQRVWRYYRVQLAGSLGQQSVIEAILTEAKDKEEELQLQALSLRGPARRGNAREDCLNAYIALWQHTNKPTDLFNACELHVGFDAPEFVLEHVDILLDALPTIKTLKLVLAALNNTHHWQGCLDKLNKHRGLLANAIHVLDFQSMECLALFQTGRYSQALDLAKQIAHEYPSKEHIVSWFDKAAQAGNSAHMIEAAQFALSHGQSPSDHLLHMAEQLGTVHSELALQLFRTAAKSPEIRTPHVAAFAFVLASRMGITDELEPGIFQAAVSPGGPMRSYTFEQTIELMQEHQRSTAEDHEKYRLGQVYVHAFANAVGYPISAIFHDACPPAHEEYFAAPSRLWSARIRHGRRSRFVTPAPPGPWKLHLDVTSVLLAHRLGVLSVLEKTDAQISFSPRLPGLLLEEMKRLNERQPSREKEVEHLLALVDAGKIRVTSQYQKELAEMDSWAAGMTQNWRRAFSAAVETQGVLIDFWPLDLDFDHNQPLELPSAWQMHVGGPYGLVQGMIEAGWIEDSDIAPKILSHNTFAPLSPSVHLAHGMTVILDAEIARSLFEIGALDTLVSSCKVWITYEEEQRCRESQRQAKYQDEIIASVDALQKHVQAELGRRFLPGPTSDHDIQHKNDTLLFRSVLDFTAASRIKDIILVAEDRWITGFLHVGDAHIVGLLDILFWLYKAQAITASNFFGCLHRLRLGNARYIPLCKEELLFRLKVATNLHTRQLQETPELEVIRRYYAACYLDAKSLKLGNAVGAEDSELTFLTQIFQVTASVFAELWLNEEDSEIRETKARWLLHAMATDVASIAVQILDPQGKPNLAERELEDLFCLFCCQVEDIRRPENLANCAGSFAAWIIRELKLPASTYRSLFQAIRNMVRSYEADHPQQEKGRGIQRFATRVVMGLLPAGQDYLPFSRAEKKQFGMIETISIGRASFERDAIWAAIAQAMSGITVAVNSSQEGEKLEYKIIRDLEQQEAPCVAFDDGSEKPLKLEMDLLHLLGPDFSERMTLLRSKRAELDLSPEGASAIFDFIAEVESPGERIYQYQKLDDSSTTSQFKRFTTLRSGSNVSFNHIETEARPLGITSLLRHAGFEPGDLSKGDLIRLFAAKAPRLIEDYGLLDAFGRQASLPVRLPDIWSTRLFALPESELNEFIQTFEVATASPLIRLQLACILMRSDSNYKERGVALLGMLIGDDSRDAWSFFRAVLQWSWRSLSMRNDTCLPEEKIFCAWLHAGIFQFWVPRPVHSSNLIETFQQLDPGVSLLFQSQSMFLDVAHPLYFSARWLLAHALPKLVSIDTLPADLKGVVIAGYRAMVIPPDEAPLPTASVMELREEWANTLESFLVPSSSDDLNGWVPEEQKSLIVQESLSSQLQELCQDRANADLLKTWLFLINALHLQGVPKSLQEAVQIQLEAFSFSKVEVSEARSIWMLANFIFVQRIWYRTNDEDFWMRHLDECLTALDKLDGKSLADYALDVAFVMNSAWGNDPAECAKRFADTVIQMVRKRSSVAKEAWMAVSAIVQSQNHAIQPLLWPMLAEVRALAARKGV